MTKLPKWLYENGKPLREFYYYIEKTFVQHLNGVLEHRIDYLNEVKDAHDFNVIKN